MNDSISDTPSCEASVPWQHRAIGFVANAFVSVIAWLPGWCAYALADLCAPILLLSTLRHERRVGPQGRGLFRNLRIAFRGRLTRSETRRLFIAWARHMTRLVVEFARIPRLNESNLSRYVDTADVRIVRRLIRQHGAVIVATGHIGNWELLGPVAGLCGIPVTGVARPIAIEPIDDMFQRIRSTGGHRVLAKWGVIREIRRVIARNGLVGLVADENNRDDPVFAPFLGTLAATHATPAVLHLRTGAPLVVATCARVGRERFRIHVWRVIQVQGSRRREQDIARVTQMMNAALSEAILAYPEQWFWGSRRFMTRPDGEVLGDDGLPPPYEGGTTSSSVR